MNTNNLKKFAQEARRKLIEQVGAKLVFVLNSDSVELREQAEQVQQLRQALNHSTKELLVEKVAYTWFNRLMALRFMDANDYQPIGIRIITPKDGYTTPEILDEAKRGNISDELKLNRQRVFDLLDGKIPSTNPQNEAFKHLLIASCNHLNTVFPFLFERINDYTELLLPDDLTSDFSIVKDIRNGMLVEDCINVEIIGWLYQFYISEENERLIKAKNTYKKNEIAPASQLFTPKWIVQYMVDNTLGQLLTELFPSTSISKQLEFYIKPEYSEQLKPREKRILEQVTFFDPCVGSAHIVSYAFDVFYLIYKEQGYNESEIPALIISNNLFGSDIDERATQLSSFVLMMKGRQYSRRFFKENIRPNIVCFKDFDSNEKFNNASVVGALIQVEPLEKQGIPIEQGNLFADSQIELNKLYTILGQRYDVVVTNPPYISESRMEGSLKQFVEENYPETKSDLFATFIIRCLELCNEDGFTGYMSPFVWMFIVTYEKLRKIIINEHFINNLIQLEYSGFDGATVPICTFTLRKNQILDSRGSYIRLSDFKGAKNQAPKTLEAIQNPKCGWFFTANQKDFDKISGSPIGYWLSEKVLEVFSNNLSMKEVGDAKQGLATTDNNRFCRFWSEVPYGNIGLNCSESMDGKYLWYPLSKGGDYRKWYGNLSWVVNYQNDGEEIKSNVLRKYTYLKTPDFVVKNQSSYFKECISWSDITSGSIAFRFYPKGTIISDVGIGYFPKEDINLFLVLGIVNTKLYSNLAKVLNPTLHFKGGNFHDLPYCPVHEKSFEEIVRSSVINSKQEWNSRETSWDYQQNELTRIKGQDLEETYDLYTQYWKNKFFQLYENENELNRQFIEIYDLQEELSSSVPLEEITILKDETVIENGQLVFKAAGVFAQFISYSVGCMFGRYSLDKEGLILANEGETLQDYLHKIDKTANECSFLPDADNIIPVLDDEWFEDDITSLFYQFLKVSFGEKNFNKNLAFVEESLGKDIRKYFTKDFYPDHIKRYKKRPIYWMFSSPKGSFSILIYMHRYTPDTISNILNKYLREFIGKLKNRKEHLQNIMVSGSPSEKTKAIKENDSIDKMLIELQEYERDILFPLATERISIDLDDGVLVNYNKFGKAVKEVTGLNDAITKKKVKEFDWIDITQIR